MSQVQSTQPTASSIVAIPHNLLIRGKDNVRTVKPEKSADQQLIASIRALGVLQNIVVKPSEVQPGFFEVDAGGRRFGAVGFLIKKGIFAEDYPIPAKIETEGSSAETSLAENLHAPMHPADEFAAFATMRKDGISVAEIAEHFGMDKQRVTKRLKLADVHPKILNAYRKETINLETVMAFTLVDSKTQQLAVFNELGAHCYAHNVRRLLTKNGVRSDGALAKYVTVDAYKAAGGSVVSDMFESRAYLPDGELLQQLAANKLEKSAERLRNKEGWQHVDVVMDRNLRIRPFHRLEPRPVGVPSDLTEALKVGIGTQREMEDSDQEWTEEREQEFAALSETIAKCESLIDKYRQYSHDDKAKSRCFVSVGHNGRVLIDRGLVSGAQHRAADRSDSTEKGEAQACAAIPNALRVDLGRQRQHIAKAALAKNAPLASDVLLYTLGRQVLEMHGWDARAIDANFTRIMPDQAEITESKSSAGLVGSRDNVNTEWLTAKTVAARFAALRKLSPKAKQTLLAYCVAECLTIDLAQERDDDIREAILADLAPDYAASWRPSGEQYFKRLTIPALLAQGTEWFGAKWQEQHRRDKKKDLVAWFDAFFNDKAPRELSDEHREIRERWLPKGFVWDAS